MKLIIKNFRSVKEQELELAPITVVYGPNGAGKSSLLYSLLTLKNVVMNPNQNPSGFFNYTFASLGSFDAVVFDHQVRNEMELGIEEERDGISIAYEVTLGEKSGNFKLHSGALTGMPEFKVKLELPVTFPYPANQQIQQSIAAKDGTIVITWNGITAQVQSNVQDPEAKEGADALATLLNFPVESLRRAGIVPLKRGFSKPHYSPIPVSPIMITEDEVATILSNDKYLVSKVSFYLEKILERDFRVNFQPGTAIFSLDSTDKKTGVASELVNEGFGVNQVVYFLAKCLHRDMELLCIEEPEIHLHPSGVRGLAKALVQMTHEEGKRFLVSTHNESFLTTLLTLVGGGQLKRSELACYFAKKEKKVTKFDRQIVNEKGQIEGGLSSFMEGELEDLKNFLKVA